MYHKLYFPTLNSGLLLENERQSRKTTKLYIKFNLIKYTFSHFACMRNQGILSYEHSERHKKKGSYLSYQPVLEKSYRLKLF